MGDGNRTKPDAFSRVRLFQGIRPLQTSQIPKDILAGVTLAAMNIPEALGYTRIAGTPVVTALHAVIADGGVPGR